MCRHTWCLELLPVRVPATSGLPRDEAEPRGTADYRGTEQRAGTSTPERATRARGREDAPGLGGLARHPVQEDLHEQARERVDTLRRHRGIHRHIIDLLGERARQDTQRTVREVRSA